MRNAVDFEVKTGAKYRP